MQTERRAELDMDSCPRFSPFNEAQDKYYAWEKIPEVLETQWDALVAGEADWPLFLYGEPGSGKSCAALCYTDAYGGWFTSLPNLHALILEIRAERYYYGGVNGGRATVREVWKDWATMPLVVVDDIGIRGTVSDAQYETLKFTLDKREGKPAIFIANLNPEQLTRIYDDPIVSRLCAGTVLEMETDRRKNKA